MVHIGAGVCLKRIYEISGDGFGKGKGWVCTPGATSRNFLDSMGWKKGVPMFEIRRSRLGTHQHQKGWKRLRAKEYGLHAPYTHNVAFELRMLDLVQSCFLTALAHLPAPTMDGCLPTFCAPKAGRLGTACWPIVFPLILRPSNLCFRCWTLRSSPCSGKWPLPSSHRRSACNRSRGGGTINARCTCRHPWQGHGLAWSSDWLSQNLPWEFLFAVSLFFLISKAARKMTCHATRDELHTKSKLRVMHVLKDEYCAQWFLLPIETFSTRGSKSLHPYTQHIPCCVWVLFRVPSWLLDSGFQKNRGINSPPQTSIILAWVSTHTIHVVHPDVYWLDGMFCSEWDVCFSTFWVLATTKSNPLRSWPCFFFVTKDL